MRILPTVARRFVRGRSHRLRNTVPSKNTVTEVVRRRRRNRRHRKHRLLPPDRSQGNVNRAPEYGGDGLLEFRGTVPPTTGSTTPHPEER